MKHKVQQDYQKWSGDFPRLNTLWQHKFQPEDFTEKAEDKEILQALKIDV